MTSRLILLCAPAFAGKTSLSRALAARGWLRISTDDILRGRGLEPGRGLPVEVWDAVSKEACSLIASAAQEERDVVFDDTLCFRFLRDRYREVGERAGVSMLLVVLKISFEEIRARVSANRSSVLRQDIDDGLLDTHLASFEWPSAEEPQLEIDATASLEQQLALVSAALGGALSAPR